MLEANDIIIDVKNVAGQDIRPTSLWLLLYKRWDNNGLWINSAFWVN